MDTLLIVPFIKALQSLPAELVSFILFGACSIAILLLLRLFGANGLYLYNIVAVLASNIQVLRGAQFSMSAEPVALGTVVFATTYLCSDMLTEHYGKEAAKRGVWFCFAAQLLMTLLMIITIGHPPVPIEALGSPGTEHMPLAEQALSLLFTPSPRLLFASLLAFVISQFNDIWLFHWIGKLTQQRWLWLRTTVSSLVSALVDTIIFSLLSWVILAPQPISFSVIVFTYILGSFVMRVLVNLLSTPVMYLSYIFKPLRHSYV